MFVFLQLLLNRSTILAENYYAICLEATCTNGLSLEQVVKVTSPCCDGKFLGKFRIDLNVLARFLVNMGLSEPLDRKI